MQTSNSTSTKAIVIGAGIGGLATAIRLALKGYEVHVFEKNSYAGGKLRHFTLGEYQFDAGPSLFTQPNNIVELFELAGEPIDNYFSYQSLPVACHYFYPDGTALKAYTNTIGFAEEVANNLGENPQQITNYLTKSAALYDNLGTLFLKNSLHKPRTFLRKQIFKAIGYSKPSLLLKSLNKYNQQYFKNPKTIQLFNRYATYNGSNPYKAPGMLSVIPHLEHNEGTFYPKGGMVSIVKALHQLAEKKGVQFHFGQAVECIIHHQEKVKGVVVGGKNMYASLVVSNMDVYFTYKHLLNNEQKAQKLLKQERSSSALIFYWGIKKSFPQLGLHNIFFSGNYQQEFDCLFKLKTLHPDPTVYINITSKCEPGIQAPDGCENWFVMINAPANYGQNWPQFIEYARKAIITKLRKELSVNIEELIEVEEVASPLTIESETASYMGSLYGTSSNSPIAAFLRHANFTNAIKGLYFVGGSV
ncbi:MAG: 1-hydroxycarotenoid 3,4-desaturase CrtD, partial [Chitinophagaceae bacterium]